MATEEGAGLPHESVLPLVTMRIRPLQPSNRSHQEAIRDRFSGCFLATRFLRQNAGELRKETLIGIRAAWPTAQGIATLLC